MEHYFAYYYTPELNSNLSNILIPKEIFSGGILDINKSYNYTNSIGSRGLVLVKVGLTSHEKYVTWSLFPVSTLGDQVTFTDFFNVNCYYQVKATFGKTSMTLNEISRGANWATQHIYIKIYLIS